MKVEVSKTELMGALEVAGRALDAKSSLPIYSALMLEAETGSLRATGTDGEVTLTARAAVDALPVGAGKVAVIGEGFLSVVKLLKGPGIALQLEKNALVVRSGRSRYALPIVTGEAWPVIPVVQPELTFRVMERALSTALQRVIPAMGTDTSRPVLCGTYWRIGQETLTVVATDTQRLHVTTVPRSGVSGEGAFILGAGASKELVKVLAAEQECQVSTDGGCVKVETASGTFISRLIGGSYLDYMRFVPNGGEFVQFDCGEMEEAVRRASFVAQGAADRLVISLRDGNTALLEAASEQYGEAEEELAVVGGQLTEQRFALSSRNLGAAIAAVPGPIARLYRSPQARGILISGENGEEFFAVLTPMRLPHEK